MGRVISIIEYRQEIERRAEQVTEPDPAFVCTSCDSEHFVLHVSGGIRCAGCDALIANIRVTETSPNRSNRS